MHRRRSRVGLSVLAFSAALVFLSTARAGSVSSSHVGTFWGWLKGPAGRLGTVRTLTAVPPVGNWTLGYRHRFHSSGPYSGATTIPKPDPTDWVGTSYRYPGGIWENNWEAPPVGQPTTFSDNGHVCKSTDGCGCWNKSQWSGVTYNMAPARMGGALTMYAQSINIWAFSEAAWTGANTWA